MRYMFLDSNIFFDNWQLNSATFQRLQHFVTNSNTVLLIPEVVCLEVQSLYLREPKRLTSELRKHYDKLQRQLATNISFDAAPLTEHYDFRQLLLERFQFVAFLPY